MKAFELVTKVARTLVQLIAMTLIAEPIIVTTARASATPFPPGMLKATQPPRVSYRSIPLEKNFHVRKWIRYFTRDNRERFDRFMERGARYRTLVQEILADNGVPPEMYYLAMIESGYASRARSRASAVGIWQFIAPTARRYGLRVDHEVDERIDIRRSTKAAARYLLDLREEFGSWYLAMAAYNCGEGRIRRIIKRHKTRDYWTLMRQNALPAETAQYVPKFQAAMHIARNPQAYGFDHKTHYDFPEVRKVKVQGRLPLREIARNKRVSLEAMRALNPHLLREKTPRAKKGYEIWVPR
jgi:membrane-bound lytic murein transglycosylase D